MPTQYSNLPTDNNGVTQKFFDQYFDKNFTITENELSAIVSYFESRTSNKTAAKSLALAVISGAVEQNLQPMEILDQFKKLPQQQLDTYLAYFLNLTRYPTSLVGLSSVPVANRYVARSILP